MALLVASCAKPPVVSTLAMGMVADTSVKTVLPKVPKDGGRQSLTLQMKVANGGYRSLALAEAYTRASVSHLVIKLFTVANGVEAPVLDNQGTQIQADIAALDLDAPLTFTNLKAYTTYRVRAYAYKSAGLAAGDLISVSANSFVNVTVANDEQPAMGNLKVKLMDVITDGAASNTNIEFEDGNLIHSGTEGIVVGSHTPTPAPTPSSSPAATPTPIPSATPTPSVEGQLIPISFSRELVSDDNSMGYTQGGYLVQSSSEYWDEQEDVEGPGWGSYVASAWKAFDGVSNQEWRGWGSYPWDAWQEWLRFKLPSPVQLSAIRLTAPGDWAAVPREFRLQAFVAGSWQDVYVFPEQTDWGAFQQRTLPITLSQAYDDYRLYFISSNGDEQVALTEVELFRK